MKNKVLVKLYVPELDFSTDIFLPVNEVLWKIKTMVIHVIFDMAGGALDREREYIMVNKDTSYVYPNNAVLIDTDIRNATEIIMLSVK